MSFLHAVLLGVLLCDGSKAASSYYDTYTGEKVSEARVNQLRAFNLIPWCALEVEDCDPHEHRRSDGSCNNMKYPPRGAQLTPYHRLLHPQFASDGWLRVSKSGRELPNARALRVSILPDGRLPNDKYTHMVTNSMVFITGDVTSVHDTVNYVAVTRHCCEPVGRNTSACMPISVADDDVHLRRSNVRCLNLTRAITYQRLGCVPQSLPAERINTAMPMLDLSIVYGHETSRANMSRTGEGGRLRSEELKGKEWPPGTSRFCVNNRPPTETRCHEAPVNGVNSVLGLNLLFMWLYRNHNAIADILHKLNPCWDDDQLYIVAKDINIAMMQQVFYYELMPSLMGYEYLMKNEAIFNTYGHVDDYDEKLEPRVSIEYVVATRWFHTMQEGRMKMYTKTGKYYGELPVVDLLLRTGILPLNNTIEGITQGMFRQPAGTNDYVVDPDVGERILTRLQFASDVVSSDIMKGRDAGLPPYNEYRKYCGLPKAHSFKDLKMWMPSDQVEAIESAYEYIEDVDLMIGIISEYPMPGSNLGPTLACIITDQLRRWRRADRFWYENTVHPGALTKEQLYEIRKMTMSRLICDHGDDVVEIQPNAFILPGPGNEIRKCHAIPHVDLSPWKDHSCNKDQPEQNDGKKEDKDPVSNKEPSLDEFKLQDGKNPVSYKEPALDRPKPEERKGSMSYYNPFLEKPKRKENKNPVSFYEPFYRGHFYY